MNQISDAKEHRYYSKMTSFLKKHRTIILISVLLLTIISSNASATDLFTNSSRNITDDNFIEYNITTTNNTVCFFYSRYCGACHRAIPVIEEISKKYPGVEIHYYDTYNSSENRTLFHVIGDRYNTPFPSYPVLFAGDTIVMEGVYAITSNSGDIFQSIDEGLIPDSEYEKRWMQKENYPSLTEPKKNSEINIFLVATAGLIDGINPCAFAVLVFLLIALMSAKSKKKMILSGLAYTSAVFLFYILAGLGILGFIQFAGFSGIFSIFAGIVAITAGFINILDALLKKSPLSLSIPQSSKKFIDRFIKNASIPAAFCLGLIIGLFELPCTGGIYLAIISLLSTEMTFFEGVPYLILYNAFFVLPLVVITIACVLGLSPESVNRLREDYRKSMKTAMGIILIFIGMLVIWWQF